MAWGVETDQSQTFLYPGLTLDNKVHKPQFAAPLVGEIFETLSHRIAGKGWQRMGGVNGEHSGQENPDLWSFTENAYIESKATQGRHYFKVASEQLEGYAKMAEHEQCNIVYYLWSYKARHLVKEGKTIRGIIERVVKSITHLDIVHWSILYAAMRHKAKFCQYREYKSWRNNTGGHFKILQVGHPWLEQLRANPLGTLGSQLRLDPGEYETLTPSTARKRVRVKFDGVPFCSCYFPVNSFVRVW